jgi:hypothetical protein
VRCGVNDNDTRVRRPVRASEACPLEDEMEATLREADLALAEAEFLSKSQRDRGSSLAFAKAPASLSRRAPKRRALPSLL